MIRRARSTELERLLDIEREAGRGDRGLRGVISGNDARAGAAQAKNTASSAVGGLKSAAGSLGDAAKSAGKSAKSRSKAGRK